MDLWSLAGSNLYGLTGNSQTVNNLTNPYSYLTIGNVINPYAYLNTGQSVVSGSSAFAQQLSQYSRYYGNGGFQSALQAIESDPELKEKVTDTLKDVYQAMEQKSQEGGDTLQNTGSGTTFRQQTGQSASKSASTIRSAQACDAYRLQMNSGERRTPTMHAPAKFSD